MRAVVDVDIARSRDGVADVGPAALARVIVRCGRRPLGTIDVPVRDGRIDGATLVETILGDAALQDVAIDVAAERWLAGGARPVRGALPTWTVAVCTRDRPVALRRCLDALTREASRCGGGDIIVVDNAPRDDATAAVASEFAVRYVVEHEPGLNPARRRALREGGGDIVLFTDDDAVVEPGWLPAMLAPFVDRRVGAVTGAALPLALDTPAQLLFERHSALHRGFRRLVFDLTSHPPAGAGAVGVGASMALRREAIECLGVFDPSLDAGTPSRSGGDTYALYRVLAEGWRAVYTPEAVVRHEHRSSMPAVVETLSGYSTGVFVVLLRALLHHRDLQAARVGAQWFRSHHVRELWRAVRRTPDAYPMSLVLAEWRGVARAPGAYRRTRWS